MSKRNSCADRKFYFAYWSLRSPRNKSVNNLFSLCNTETRFWISVLQYGDFAIPASVLPTFAFFLFFVYFYAHTILSSCCRTCSSFYIPYSILLLTKPKSGPAIAVLCESSCWQHTHLLPKMTFFWQSDSSLILVSLSSTEVLCALQKH